MNVGENIMYICLECFRTFETPQHYVETHGFDTPPYEEWNGCPYCGGSYTKAIRCDCCEEWIRGAYIKTRDMACYCEDCYIEYEIGDE